MPRDSGYSAVDWFEVTGQGASSKKEELPGRMKDFEDNELKSEMDEIMRGVECIMKKVETVLLPKSGEVERTEE